MSKIIVCDVCGGLEGRPHILERIEQDARTMEVLETPEVVRGDICLVCGSAFAQGVATGVWADFDQRLKLRVDGQSVGSEPSHQPVLELEE